MNRKMIISFLAGTVAGGLGMHAYLTKYKKIEYEVIEPKIEEESEVNDGDMSIEIDMDDFEDEPVGESDIMAYYKEKGASDEPTIDYRQFSKKMNDVEMEQIDVSKIVKNRGPMKFEITEEQAMYREEEYDTAAISLYDDGAVVDESNGMEVRYKDEEVDDFIGAALIKEFADDPDKESLYVENVMYGTIYEVHKRHENFLQDYVDEMTDEE